MRYSTEDRRRLIEEHSRSGLTKKAFCEQAGINLGTFHGWRKKVPPLASAPGFAEVALCMSPAAPIEIDLPNGVRIRVRTTGDVSRTAELIRAVAAPLKGGTRC